MLSRERKRTERTGTPFLLVLIDFEPLAHPPARRSFDAIGLVIAASTRDTDVTGWQRNGSTLGVIFTALNGSSREVTRAAVGGKIRKLLTQNLSESEAAAVTIAFHFFPEEGGSGGGTRVDEGILLDAGRDSKTAAGKLFALVKRASDIAVSLLALMVLSPFLLLISIAIKMTSAGPVFFTQRRVGRYGAEFTLVKFRSMYGANDSRLHLRFSQSLARGSRDPRITPFGAFLRASRLDELPQLVNVLAGTMSIVGPLPAIPYEFECYQLWHRRRILNAKPGMTGLWQVNGRQQTSFDDMVRMDLQYIRDRSFWVDLKILLKTPLSLLKL
jgi:lipopolysaccharide/colanic/teichoic acid biosynthesis glycosyltransferase